jgi:hypothetical protein
MPQPSSAEAHGNRQQPLGPAKRAKANKADRASFIARTPEIKRIGGKALASSISAGIADTIEKIVTTHENRLLCQVGE